MKRENLYAACIAGAVGAAFPWVLMALRGLATTGLRPPMARVAAFLNPLSGHAAPSVGMVVFDVALGSAVGLAMAALIARLARDRRMVGTAFLATFAVAAPAFIALHEDWAHASSVFGQPLVAGFVAAIVMGVWWAPPVVPGEPQ